MTLLSTAQQNVLPDSAFGYIEPGGKLDSSGRTVPRTKRHFPLHDAAHVRDALSRIGAGAAFGKQAMPKVLAAAKKFGIAASAAPPGRSGDPRIELRRKAAKGSREDRLVAGGLELRDSGSNIVQLVGSPIKYNVAYKVRDHLGQFTETMRHGVVSDLLAHGCDTRFLFNHQGLPLGRTTSGTLRLEDSPSALRCVVDLDTRQQLATDLAVAVERGDVNQMSIGMVVSDDRWDARGENREVIRLSALEDVSAVVYPASPTTSISVAGSGTSREQLAAEVRALQARRTDRVRQQVRHDLERIAARQIGRR